MAYVQVSGLTKRFDEVTAISEVSFDLEQSEMLALLGPSGAGKTTTIRCIAGLETPESGDILVEGRSWIGEPAGDRDVAVVFPTYSLYFHMTVRENIRFPLMVRGVPEEEIEARVQETARLLGIDHLLDRKPRRISGGERQRVAIGRAIVRRPRLFLFDEPLTFLDAKLREQLRVELRRIQRELGIAAVFVTSDPVEALTVGDRIAVLHEGRLLQEGAARELYTSPGWLFVGDLFSRPQLNRIPVRYEPGPPATLTGPGIAIPWERATRAVSEAVLAFRPEDTRPGADGPTSLPGLVRLIENLGPVHLVLIETEIGQMTVHTTAPPPLGAAVHVEVPVSRAFLFDAESGLRLDEGLGSARRVREGRGV